MDSHQVRQNFELQMRSPTIPENPKPQRPIGLSAREVGLYSLARAIVSARPDLMLDGLEGEVNRAICEALGVVPSPCRFFVPVEVMRRDLTASVAGAGGYLAATKNVSFTAALYDRMLVRRMGATILNLTNNATIPGISAGDNEYWLGSESTPITESTPTFKQLGLSFHHVGVYAEYSRQLLLQSSPTVDAMLAADFGRKLGASSDKAVLQGSGASGQPTGIVNSAGIGSVVGTSLAAGGVIEFQLDIAGANVTPARPGYVTTPTVAALLMARPELPSTGTTRLWTGNLWDGALLGMPAMSTKACPAATLIAGDWETLVLAEFGILEIAVNPFAAFQSGIYGVRAFYAIDVGLRYPAGFSVAISIT